MSLHDHMARGIGERRRLYILTALRDCPGYMAESSALQQHLTEQHYLQTSTHVLTGDLVMLKSLGLIHLLAEGTAAKLTAAGLDAANGAEHYPGVARPLPE